MTKGSQTFVLTYGAVLFALALHGGTILLTAIGLLMI